MAKVTCPLLSIAASGSIGRGSINYRQHSTKTHACAGNLKTRKPTLPMLQHRRTLAEAHKIWKAMPWYAILLWKIHDAPAYIHSPRNNPHRTHAQGKNAFIKDYFARLRQHKPPRMLPISEQPAAQYKYKLSAIIGGFQCYTRT